MKRSKRRDSIIRSKKGNAIIDLILVLIVLVVMSIVTIVCYKAFNEVNADLQADTEMSAQGKAVSSNLYGRFPATMDSIFALVMVSMWGLVLVASYYIDARPIFFIFTFILLVFVLIAAMSFGNYYEDFTADDEFSTLATDFPMTNFIMSHFLSVMMAIGLTIMLVLFGKVV